MQSSERDIHAVQEARRQAAARVRTLLEELEAAEREFEALTEKVKILTEALPPHNPSRPVSSAP